MKTVDITDIEDLILCKHEIDLKLIEKGDLEEKMTLPEFMQKYVNLNNMTYLEDDVMIPFAVVEVYDLKYLFVSQNTSDVDKINSVLNKIKFDFSKLQILTNHEIMLNNQVPPMLLINGKYYKI